MIISTSLSPSPSPVKLSVTLSKTLDESLALMSQLKSSRDVAELLEIPEGQLLYLLYRKPIIQKYRTFEIPKKTGGVRLINSPIGGVNILLSKLQEILQALYKVKPCVHGFVNKKSIISNSLNHVKKKYVLNIDIEDFYGAINFGRIRGMFMAKPFNVGEAAATVLAQLCTLNQSLPQGAPTSPVLSNLIAINLDNRLMNVAKRYGLHYTRYADDITFSTSKTNFPRSIAYWEGNNPITSPTMIGSLLSDEVEASGFKINKKKSRLQIPSMRQDVTGLTVNEFLNVKRSYIRKTRAMIFAWKKFGLANAELEYITKYMSKKFELKDDRVIGRYFKSVVYGRLAFLKMVRGGDDVLYRKLCLQVIEIDHEPPKFIKEIKLKYDSFDLFICHASEDKGSVAEPIYNECEKLGVKVFLDNKFISWGDSLTEKINHALGQARFVLAIISKDSLGKSWPLKELNSAISREIQGEQKVLALLVGDVDLNLFPLIQDKLFNNWKNNPEQLAQEIKILIDKRKGDI